MAKKKNLLNKFEREILRLLNQSLVPLSPHAIAEKLGISYNTATKYVSILESKNLIKKQNDK